MVLFPTYNQPLELPYELFQSIAVDDATLVGNNIIFYVVLPTDLFPQITMSPWFQWMIALMQIRPRQDPRVPLASKLLGVLS